LNGSHLGLWEDRDTILLSTRRLIAAMLAVWASIGSATTANPPTRRAALPRGS
jgi:hypothetical protein